MIMEMGELWIYWKWTHILEWSYARQYFLDEASKLFLIFLKKHKWTYPLTNLNTTRVAMWIIFGSGRNVFAVEEPS
jgi:hypothetical protein